MNSNQVERVSKNSNKSQSPSKKKKSYNIRDKENKENDAIKSENPKTKLLNALNNINDEINVVIDSKDQLINNNLNLDIFIKKKSSKSSSCTKSPDKFINVKPNIKNKYISPITDKDDEKPIIKTETSNDNRNLRKINKIISKDIIENIKTEPRQLNKYINSSLSSQISKSKNSEFNMINTKISKNSYHNIINSSNQDKEKEIKIENNSDAKNKITLHNLNTEDKILIKDMEDKDALVISDISSLNKKNITNYNITISNFKIQKILEYYFSLLKLYEKEKNENMDLENEIRELKSRYLDMKKNELSTNSRKDSDRLNNSTIRTISVGKYGPLSRYQNDLNFFKDLIFKMNDEIKNT